MPPARIGVSPGSGSDALDALSVGAIDSVLATPGGESEILVGVAQGIADSSVVLSDALTALAQRVCTLLGCQGASVALVEQDVFATVAAVGTMSAARGERSPIRATLGELALAQQRALVSNDAEDDARTRPETVARYGIRQGLVAPMIVEGGAIGRLLAVNAARGEFLPADAALLQRLADHAALAVRARQHQARAERSAREARALTELIQRINQSLEVDRVFALLAKYAAELAGGVGARVLILEGDALHACGVHGVDMSSFDSIIPIDGSFAGACLRGGTPIRTPDLGAPNPSWPRTAACVTPGRYNGLAVPLLVAERAHGAIVVLGNPEPGIDGEDGAVLGGRAGHGAVASEDA
ncbi:MAG: GAF domain-containing protein, partial [Gemmatimonadaceae bacterium]